MSLFGSGFLPCPSPFNPLSRPVPLPSTLLRKSRFVGSSPQVFKTSHRSVLTPADKEHALPEFAVQQLNALIEGDTAVKCFFLLLPPPFPFFFFFAAPPRRFEENKKKKLALTRALPFSLSLSLSLQATLTFDSCSWWFASAGLENVCTFFKLLAGAARASGCQTADFLIKRCALPTFGSSGSIPVVGPAAFSSSTCADLTHASTLVHVCVLAGEREREKERERKKKERTVAQPPFPTVGGKKKIKKKNQHLFRPITPGRRSRWRRRSSPPTTHSTRMPRAMPT